MEHTDLPDYLPPKERHQRAFEAGEHPEIDLGVDARDVRSDSDETGRYITNGDELIGFMERNQCPVCGARGSLSVRKSFTFVFGAHNRVQDGDGGLETNETIQRLEDSGYRAISCRQGTDYYVGVASESAAKEYESYVESASERRGFRSRARSLIGRDRLSDMLGHGYPHGVYLAAIFEQLGAVDYDERELMDKTSVTKADLAAIIRRLQDLDTRPEPGLSVEDWLFHRHVGAGYGVEWHIPEWVESEGLRYADDFRKSPFA